MRGVNEGMKCLELVDKIADFVEKKKRIILFLCLLIFYVGLVLYGAKKIGYYYAPYNVTGQSAYTTEELKSGEAVEQQFSVPEGYKPQYLELIFATYSTKVTGGTYELHIYKEDGTEVYAYTGNATEITDNANIKYYVGESILNSNELYTVSIVFYDIDDQIITLYTDCSDNTEYSSYVGGEIIENDITIKLLWRKIDFFFCMYIAICAVIMMLIIAVYLMLYKLNVHVENIVFTVVVIVGFIYNLVFPVYSVPDEDQHLYKSYYISNSLLFVDNLDEGSKINMRSCDADAGLRTTNINRGYYDSYYSYLKTPFVSESDTEIVIKNGARGKSSQPYLYVISALGITIGRLLKLNTVYSFMFGRILNLLLYALVLRYCLKKIPLGKSKLIIWAMLPMALHQIMSYNYDCSIFILSMLVITMSLYISHTTEKISILDWVILVGSALLLAPVKSYAYIAIVAVAFLCINKIKKKDKKSLFAGGALIIGLIMIFVIPKIVSAFQDTEEVVSTSSTYIVPWTGTPGYTIGYLVSHVTDAIYVLYDTVVVNAGYYLSTCIGSSLGWLEIKVSDFIIAMFFMLIVVTVVSESETIILSNKARIYLRLLAIFSMFVPILGMWISWTPLSSSIILGVQGRYFLIPVLLFLLTLQKRNKGESFVYKKILLSAVALQLPTLLYVMINR